MPFEVGHKLSPGGTIGNKGGRPSNEEIAQRETLKQAIERLREERAQEFAEAYMVMAKQDPATMRHFIDKVLPQKVEIESHGKVDRTAILAIIATPNAQEAVERLTEAIAGKLGNVDPNK